MRAHIVSLLQQNAPFALWRFPEGAVQGVFPHKAQKIQSLHDLKHNGFVVFPFDKNESGYCLAADKIWTEGETFPAKENSIAALPRKQETLHSTAKESYATAFADLKQLLDSRQLEKAVLSRTFTTKEIDLTNAPKLFFALEKAYPNAMVYLVNIPEAGCWLGASPEQLLKCDQSHCATVAVAGTRKAFGDVDWTPKEIHEQQVVTDYIATTLQENNITHFKMNGPKDYFAGNVKHLRTSFTMDKEQVQDKIPDLVMALHPTPAVCGLPVQESFAAIKQAENHSREFYSGFLGLVHPGKETNLFVNLRCMQIFQDHAMLYAGGGLTIGSVLEDEWSETQNKLKTLLNIAEKLKE